MKVAKGHGFVSRAAVVLASVMLSFPHAMANEQSNITTTEVGYGDFHATVVRVDGHEYERMTSEAARENRDKEKVHRFAHEARLRASRHRESYEPKSETSF